MWINRRCLTSPTLFFCNEPSWSAHHNTRLKLMEAPQNRRFYLKMECLPLWPTYIGEKGRTLGKTYEIKARCYWEQPWGAHWEPDGNTLGPRRGTRWEHPTQNSKEKKTRFFECMLSLPIGCMKFLFPKLLVNIFCPGIFCPIIHMLFATF